MAKPSKIPTWAVVEDTDPTTGKLNRVEPSSGIKNTGFTYNEKPPRQYLNWSLYFIGEWLTWLDANVDQELNTDSDVTFHNVEAANFYAETEVDAPAGDFTDSGTGTLESDLITANASVTTPEIIITGNEGRTKRINEIVYGKKTYGNIAVPTTITLATSNGTCDSLNFKSLPTDTTKFTVQYSGKYRVIFSGYSESNTTSITQFIQVYKNSSILSSTSIKFTSITSTDKIPMNIVDIVDLLEDDEISLRVGSGGSNGGVITGTLIIEMIGD